MQPTAAAPIYALFRDGDSNPVAGQLNVIDVIPGDAGYNDFWQVVKVTVPADYVANTLTSVAAIKASGYAVTPTDSIVNCPVVPDGSTATLRYGGGDPGLVKGWYKDQVVFYFSFTEKDLSLAQFGGAKRVPTSPIYVTFHKNPDASDPTSGPPSGFVTEPGTDQTHNVTATLPTDSDYSPLWYVNIYDNADFANVVDVTTASKANILGIDVATVNCPIVEVE